MPEHPVIVIIMATLLEAEPFIEALALEKQADEPCPIYIGENLILLLSGMGKTNAAMATSYACQTFQAKMICNLGAAGATKECLPLGSIHQIGKVVESDRPSLKNGLPHVHHPHILPEFKTVVLATHDRPIKTFEERQETAAHADLCDMEGAAVVQTAGKFGVPCLLFKFVSDTPRPDEQHNIAEWIKKLRDSFCRFFLDSVLPVIQKQKSPY